MINTDSPNTKITGQHNNLGTDGKIDSKNNIFMFAKYVANLRKNSAALRQDNYNMAIYFKKEDGTSTLSNTDRCVWIRIDGSAVGDKDYLLLINSWSADVNFKIPKADTGKKWVRIIDTAQWAESNDNTWAITSGWSPDPNADYWYGVKSRSITVLAETAR